MKGSTKVPAAEPLGSRAEEDRVARGDVGDRDVGGHGRLVAILRHRDVGGQRAAAELAEVDLDDAMLDDAEFSRDLLRGAELVAVALAVVEAHRVKGQE